MPKLEYKPIALQDECWGGSKDNPEIIVLVKMEAQGKNRKYYKNDTIEFPNVHYLDKYLEENNIDVLPEKDFKTTPAEKALHLIKAIK